MDGPMPPSRWVRWWLLGALLFASSPPRHVHAQQAPEPASPAADAPCTTVRQHLPGEVRCLAHPPPQEESPWVWLPRLALAPLRLAFRTVSEVVLVPVRVEDELHLSARAVDLFFNDERTFGVYPTLGYETGIGLAAGAHLHHLDLFGRHEGLQLNAVFAGPYRQAYDARIHTGRIWNALRLSALAGYALYEDLRFYGAGNADLDPVSIAQLPLDALDPDVAVKTFYRERVARMALELEAALGGDLRLEARNQWRWRAISTGAPGDADTPWADEVFAPGTLAGLDEDLTNADVMLALVWNGWRSVRHDLPRQLPSKGTRFEAFSGAQVELAGRHPPFGRVGFDLQPLIDLYRGDRVLRLHLRGEAMLGALDAIPFFDLPTLGGASLLRGYAPQRFSGLLSLLSSVEYRYPVTESVASYLFVDAGRVYTDAREVSLSSLRESRVGFGFGLQFYQTHGVLFRLQFASSIDGGFFFALSFDPTTI
jgi:hypothetical protein